MSSIAFFSKYLPSDKPSGVSVQVHRLAQQLVKNGHSVTCFSFSPKPSDALYTVVQLPWKTTSRFLQKIYPAIAFSKIVVGMFDVVHYHGDDYLCKGRKNRVRTFYGSALDEALHATTISRWLYQSLFYCFEWISCLKKGRCVGISEVTRKRLPNISKVINCSVPLDLYQYNSENKTKHPSILFLGDLDSRKRGRLLLNVFETEVLPQFPDCTLTVIGPQACDEKKVTHIKNCSEQELIQKYQQSWIYCMASSYEGFGVPAIEAAACGCAVVATANPGISEIITDHENGLLCDSRNLGCTLSRVIEDSTLRESLVANGLKSVQRYSTQKICICYEEIFHITE
jgi:glycosyltransferase involved in cell wall biosynthesis